MAFFMSFFVGVVSSLFFTYLLSLHSLYSSLISVSRMELLTRLFTYALRQTRSYLVLAGVDISFRREIRPFQAYDTRSCILTWDNKWIYVLSYHIQAGAVVEDGDGWIATLFGKGEQAESKKGLIFTVAISKFVAKAGRRTVSPGKLLELGGFVNATASAEKEWMEVRRAHGWDLLHGK
ncbi:uncharacterized protein BCR38DRAFT_508541 [Pseudomassariella vexata]|uniref:Uncharacterized protein n=1 Tax=Pseudomassariella vexata TaxID=1141098 RepID=A0A1Y2EBX5_9PEZI|nr:uncharacterized protein BCR38DRAFT_508541 [Pseudomassariella vexata]ORY69070.1 hypothetical protein BCR38DRAFT_508541 [Pseudomassariella vexata]